MMRLESSGILLIDKPEGRSAANIVAYLKKTTGARKAGHCGTLDPFATGVLVCCLNRATKLSRFLLFGNKTYEGTMVFGTETDTQDGTGTVISETDPGGFEMEPDKMQEIFDRFKGEIRQLPPVYSALKHKGTPLYELARKGRPVQKDARTVFIHDIRVKEIQWPLVCFEVSCSAGTYIRTLATDIGRVTGCGGHLSRLCRTGSSGFGIEEAVCVDEIEPLARSGEIEKRMITPSNALRKMPRLNATEKTAERISFGRPLSRADFIGSENQAPGDDFFRVVDDKDGLLAVVQSKKNCDLYDYCCVL